MPCSRAQYREARAHGAGLGEVVDHALGTGEQHGQVDGVVDLGETSDRRTPEHRFLRRSHRMEPGLVFARERMQASGHERVRLGADVRRSDHRDRAGSEERVEVDRAERERAAGHVEGEFRAHCGRS